MILNATCVYSSMSIQGNHMGFKNTMKKRFFSGLNPVRWVGMDQIKGNGHAITDITKKLFDNTKGSQQKSPKSFEEAMRRYGLNEADLQKRMQLSLRLVYFCLGFSVLLIGYTIYLFVSHLVLSGFVTIMLTLLLWAYAFREHFNYFQMKQRRLGCTFHEWFISTFKGSKS